MTRLTDEQVAALKREMGASGAEDGIYVPNTDLRALLDERNELRATLVNVNALADAENRALTRHCERLRESLRYIAEGEWSADHARSQARAALAADEKEG